MQRLLASVVLAFSGAVYAAPITIDFEEFAEGERGVLTRTSQVFDDSGYFVSEVPGFSTLQSQGFDIVYSAGATEDLGNYPCTTVGGVFPGATGTLALRTFVDMWEGNTEVCAQLGGHRVTIRRTDLQPFAIYSLDAYLGSAARSSVSLPDSSPGTLGLGTLWHYRYQGYLSDGSIVALLNQTPQFGAGDWLEIQQLSLELQVEPMASWFFPDSYLEIDNIVVGDAVVTVVPIPAAAWLFLSALAALAARRRLSRRFP